MLDIDYSTGNSGTQTAVAIGKGNMTSFGIQIKYPVSNIWTKQ